MRNVLAVAGRELHGYFDSPIAYMVVVSFLLVAGWQGVLAEDVAIAP